MKYFARKKVVFLDCFKLIAYLRHKSILAYEEFLSSRIKNFYIC